MPTANERPHRERPSSPAIGELRAEAQIGKYRIVRHLGAGGMGAVYEAVHVEIGKSVALKLLTGALAGDPRAHARFLQEAANLSRLEHPHVVNVMDFGTDAESPYIVMELLRGEDLADHIVRNIRGLSVDKAVDILMPVLSGIIAAHQAGLIHRDIKPRNIFLAANPLKEIVPKVLDFGIAKVSGEMSDTSLTQKGLVVGTPQYIAPEQVRGAPANHLTDQYALGVVLYECLVGRAAFEGHTPFEIMKNVESGRFFAPSRIRSDLPPELERIVLQAMNRDPGARFASIVDLGRALLPFASPRQQAVWANFFIGQASGVFPGSKTAPFVSGFSAPGSTRMLPQGSPDVADSSSFVNSSTAHSTTFQTTPRRAGRLLAAALAGMAVLGGAALVSQVLRRADVEKATPGTGSSPAVDRRQPITEVTTTRESTPRIPSSTEPFAPPIPQVTISVRGAPSGVAAFLDGMPAVLPLRLQRDGQTHELTLEAAGHERVIRSFVPLEDAELEVNLKALPETAPPSVVGSPSSRKISERARPKHRRQSSSPSAPPRPFTDF